MIRISTFYFRLVFGRNLLNICYNTRHGALDQARSFAPKERPAGFRGPIECAAGLALSMRSVCAS
jgi:hypothetical protein